MAQCLWTIEWIYKLQNIHTMEKYSANEKEQTTNTQNNVDESQNYYARVKKKKPYEQNTYCMIPLI